MNKESMSNTKTQPDLKFIEQVAAEIASQNPCATRVQMAAMVAEELIERVKTEWGQLRVEKDAEQPADGIYVCTGFAEPDDA